MTQSKLSPEAKAKLLAMMADIQAKRVPIQETESPIPPSQLPESGLLPISEAQKLDANQIFDKYGNLITLNEKQMEAVELARQGKSFVLIGPAGTGKTTTQNAVVSVLIQSGLVGTIQSEGHKHLIDGTPGIMISAYTRRAVANIRKAMPEDMKNNCITFHKALEYSPQYETVIDENGNEKTKMFFAPMRNKLRPIPATVKVVVAEEGSMLGVDLFEEVQDAVPHCPQWIFLGDIQQLPPVFGPAILGFKLLELPVIELTHVYRQALESPIIRLAHRILSGVPLPASEFDQFNEPGKLNMRAFKKKVGADEALMACGTLFCNLVDSKGYDPEEDMILMPFNEAFGTIELNRKIANHLARKREAITHEIIAGFNKLYLSVGDKVLYDKEDATVIKIEKNPIYTGKQSQAESKTLDYWGHNPNYREDNNHSQVLSDEAVDLILTNVAGDSEDRVKKASHAVTLMMNDSEVEVKLESAGDLNSLLLGYALTVHKSQGSEWRRVFFIVHNSHATMTQRELLYTAVTRAKEELIIICETDTFEKGIKSQRVKGNSLEEKAEFFKGKLTAGFQLKGSAT